jgi:hypothetical protein
MVIRRYHRFIPNLTRRDGSAIARPTEEQGSEAVMGTRWAPDMRRRLGSLPVTPASGGAASARSRDERVRWSGANIRRPNPPSQVARHLQLVDRGGVRERTRPSRRTEPAALVQGNGRSVAVGHPETEVLIAAGLGPGGHRLHEGDAHVRAPRLLYVRDGDGKARALLDADGLAFLEPGRPGPSWGGIASSSMTEPARPSERPREFPIPVSAPLLARALPPSPKRSICRPPRAAADRMRNSSENSRETAAGHGIPGRPFSKGVSGNPRVAAAGFLGSPPPNCRHVADRQG